MEKPKEVGDLRFIWDRFRKDRPEVGKPLVRMQRVGERAGIVSNEDGREHNSSSPSRQKRSHGNHLHPGRLLFLDGNDFEC